MNRRDFVDRFSKGGLIYTLASQHRCEIENLYQVNSESQFWENIKSDFAIANRKDNYLHLNSGSVGTMSNTSLTSLQKLIQHMNSYPPYEALNEWKEERNLVRSRLSTLLDCGNDEISIIRNTTEGINIIINGVPVEAGNEILCAKHDYPHSLYAVKQRCDRDNLKLSELSIDLLQGDDSIVKQYVNAFNPTTKLLLLTYITHRQGYILPVKQIISEAKKRGIQVVLDAAHAVGHLDHSVRNLGADYYVSSLHKWLNAPHSTGLLYVKKEHISDLLPLMACSTTAKNEMLKFEFQGTRTFHQEVGIMYALNELEYMTIEKKEKRLKYLTNYWINQAKKIPNFIPLSSFDMNKFGAVWTFALDGIPSGKVKKALKSKYNINTKTVGTSPIGGIRISTNIYHLESDLDKFVNALWEISKSMAR